MFLICMTAEKIFDLFICEEQKSSSRLSIRLLPPPGIWRQQDASVIIT